MRRIYLGLGLYVALFVTGEGVLGRLVARGALDPSWRRWHVVLGLFTGVFVCFVHSLVFIHLLGTGLGVKRAIEEHRLDPGPKADVRAFKMRCFPPAFLCMAAAIATAVSGGAVLGGALDRDVHLALAVAALALNALAFPVVAAALGENEALLARMKRLVEERSRTGGA